MTELYKKSEIWFAVVLISVYVVGTSAADSISDLLGLSKSVTLFFHLLLSAAVLFWVVKMGLSKKYGLCRPEGKASRYLYFIPLALISSVNLWFGVQMNMGVTETLLYVGSMLCVGFLEEIIFRGFLFRAMEKDGVRLAIIVSSVTFGIGHIVNLFNGSGAELSENLCQVAYAVAFGFLFVTVFYRGGSLIPCIVSHSAINMLSAFSNEAAMKGTTNIIVSAVMCVTALGYTLVLMRTLPENKGGDRRVT